MEPILNIKEAPLWDSKKKFTIITYRKSRVSPSLAGEEIHREELTFSSPEDMWNMIMKVSTYNMQEIKISVERDEDTYTEKILTQL